MSLQLGPWQTNNDVPGAGLAAGNAVIFGDWIYTSGSASSGVITFLRAPILEGGRLGPWEVLPYTGTLNTTMLVEVSSPAPRLLVGLSISGVVRAAFIDNPNTGTLRIGGSLPLVLGQNAVGCGNTAVGLQSVPNTPGPLAGTPLAYRNLDTPAVSVLVHTAFQDQTMNPASTFSFRRCFYWGGMLWGLMGADATPTSATLIRALPMSPNGVPTGEPWKTMGSLPVTHLWRTMPAIWNDYLILAGGGVDVADANSGSSAIYAAKLSTTGLGPWVQIGSLPFALRSHLTLVDKRGYLHVLGGIQAGVASTGDYENACYSAKLDVTP